jgi:hypothetical protein
MMKKLLIYLLRRRVLDQIYSGRSFLRPLHTHQLLLLIVVNDVFAPAAVVDRHHAGESAAAFSQLFVGF